MSRLAVAGMLLAVLTFAIAAFAQDEASPARRHAQVIAHGLMTMPAGELAWRLGTRQALAAEKSAAEARDAGFVVAGDGELAVTDADGQVAAWLGPGEALWTDAGGERAIVGAAGRADYLEIALVPAGSRDAGADVVITDAFAVPDGATFDVDLIRDVLQRGEESVIPASAAPMLLVVTSGNVFVDLGAGDIDEISAGAFAQVAGEMVVSGASRAPASFVVARIGAQAEQRVSLREVLGTPQAAGAATPVATPVSETPRQAAVEISAFFCPATYAKMEFAKVCREPAAEVAFSVARRGKTVLSDVTNADGRVAFGDVRAGDITMLAGLPAGEAFSDIRCHSRSGIESRATSGSNRIALPLAAGDFLSCDWFIVPNDERLTQPSLSIAIRACPDGFTAERFRAEACATMQPGTELTLREGEQGRALPVAMARSDRWRWDGLEAGDYALDVDALPAGYADSALDRVPCCGQEHDFSIAMPWQQRLVTHTLYLFPPDVPRDRSLTVSIMACPPGMTAETFVAERCEPAPAGTTLSLLERGIDVGVAAAGSAAWQWNGLGALPYVLRVNALPEGFIAYQLDDRASVEEGPIRLDVDGEPAQTQHTLYLFRPPVAGEERDADDDGLLDAREAELGTQPFLPDSDGDGLRDGDEVEFYGSDPLAMDTDGDGLDDGEELQTHGTNPLLADTDGDGVMDAEEVAASSDPLDWGSVPASPTPLPTESPSPLATPVWAATPVS